MTKTTSKKKPKPPTSRKTTPTAWPAAGSTATNKDEAGNLIAVIAPDGGSTLIDYDDELNLPLAVTDNAGRLTEYGYDARGNLTSVTDPSGQVTRYRYTAAGLPASITDALGKSKQLVIRRLRPAGALYRLFRPEHPLQLQRPG